MRTLLPGTLMLGLSSTVAYAGGIDRNGQPISFIFEEGSFLEFSVGSVAPSLSGNDLRGSGTGNTAKTFFPVSFSYKTDLNDQLSFGVLVDQPFGAAIKYGSGSSLLGGTEAVANVTATTALLRYKFNDRFSAHGGVRVLTGNAEISLNGGAYGSLSGYRAELDNDTSAGYVLGVAFEIPEYFMRVALTYSSQTKHDFGTTESVNNVTVSTAASEVVIPQSVNLEFRTGVAPDTFVFGGARWVEWSQLRLDPPFLLQRAGEGVISFEDTTTYSLGVGRKFNDRWAGLLSLSYEPKGNPMVSPLSPANGFWGATLAAVYTKDNMRIITGVNYTKVGDATAEIGTPDTPVAEFSGNNAIGVGVKMGFSF